MDNASFTPLKADRLRVSLIHSELAKLSQNKGNEDSGEVNSLTKRLSAPNRYRYRSQQVTLNANRSEERELTVIRVRTSALAVGRWVGRPGKARNEGEAEERMKEGFNFETPFTVTLAPFSYLIAVSTKLEFQLSFAPQLPR